MADDIIVYLVIICVAFWAGWKFRGLAVLARLSEDPDHYIDILKQIKKINDTEAQEVKTSVSGTELAIERHGEMLYAFVKDTNQFIAQGQNLKDLLESAHKRFPGKVFFGNIPDGDSAKELV